MTISKINKHHNRLFGYIYTFFMWRENRKIITGERIFLVLNDQQNFE